MHVSKLQAQFKKLVEQLYKRRLEKKWDQESLRDTLRTAIAIQAFLIANGATMGECRKGGFTNRHLRAKGVARALLDERRAALNSSPGLEKEPHSIDSN